MAYIIWTREVVGLSGNISVLYTEVASHLQKETFYIIDAFNLARSDSNNDMVLSFWNKRNESNPFWSN